MKSILLPVSSKEALNVLNGDQTLLLRKSVPKDFVGWVYVYVTKGKPYLHKNQFGYQMFNGNKKAFLNRKDILNGTIPFRFWFDEYDKYVDVSDCGMTSCGVECENDFMYLLSVDPILKKTTCLDADEIEAYGNGADLYAWHISKLEVLSKVKYLEEFKLKRPPQSWCYIDE